MSSVLAATLVCLRTFSGLVCAGGSAIGISSRFRAGAAEETLTVIGLVCAGGGAIGISSGFRAGVEARVRFGSVVISIRGWVSALFKRTCKLECSGSKTSLLDAAEDGAERAFACAGGD